MSECVSPSNTTNVMDEATWKIRERELLDKISILELNALNLIDNHRSRVHVLEQELQYRTNERENFKNKLSQVETELAEAKAHKAEGSNMLSPAQLNQIELVKQKSEETLKIAKGVIFDKTKICKNQELQIEALHAQVTSLREVLSITKELLEIRNLEVEHLNEKLQCMEAKINGEKERRDLVDKKLDDMLRMNTELKNEYQIQLRIFNALKTKYHEKDELNQTEANTE